MAVSKPFPRARSGREAGRWRSSVRRRSWSAARKLPQPEHGVRLATAAAICACSRASISCASTGSPPPPSESSSSPSPSESEPDASLCARPRFLSCSVEEPMVSSASSRAISCGLRRRCGFRCKKSSTMPMMVWLRDAATMGARHCGHSFFCLSQPQTQPAQNECRQGWSETALWRMSWQTLHEMWSSLARLLLPAAAPPAPGADAPAAKVKASPPPPGAHPNASVSLSWRPTRLPLPMRAPLCHTPFVEQSSTVGGVPRRRRACRALTRWEARTRLQVGARPTLCSASSQSSETEPSAERSLPQLALSSSVSPPSSSCVAARASSSSGAAALSI
mmetsp:Transcript_40607/g.131479  ORF Transcript_40607/g.131479 Transcript_40607/m.131479 type:complete len:335 (+) Transcript_40607:412-1416(+)